MGVYGDLEAVLSHVTPRADCVADDGDVVVCHVAEGSAEGQDGQLSVSCLDEGVFRKGNWFYKKCGKRQTFCLGILWNWMDGFA